jgi:hypothetical protein
MYTWILRLIAYYNYINALIQYLDYQKLKVVYVILENYTNIWHFWDVINDKIYDTYIDKNANYWGKS